MNENKLLFKNYLLRVCDIEKEMTIKAESLMKDGNPNWKAIFDRANKIGEMTIWMNDLYSENEALNKLIDRLTHEKSLLLDKVCNLEKENTNLKNNL